MGSFLLSLADDPGVEVDVTTLVGRNGCGEVSHHLPRLLRLPLVIRQSTAPLSKAGLLGVGQLVGRLEPAGLEIDQGALLNCLFHALPATGLLDDGQGLVRVEGLKVRLASHLAMTPAGTGEGRRDHIVHARPERLADGRLEEGVEVAEREEHRRDSGGRQVAPPHLRRRGPSRTGLDGRASGDGGRRAFGGRQPPRRGRRPRVSRPPARRPGREAYATRARVGRSRAPFGSGPSGRPWSRNRLIGRVMVSFVHRKTLVTAGGFYRRGR